MNLTFHGFLLRKTSLSNDDLLLECLTASGKQIIFAPRAAKSRKKMAEIDYFRVLEMQCTQKNQNLKLKTVRCLKSFPHFTQNWDMLEQGTIWLKILQKNIAENDPLFDMYPIIELIFTNGNEKNIHKMDFYLKIKLIQHFGQIPLSENKIFTSIISEEPKNAIKRLLQIEEKTFLAFQKYQQDLENYLEKKGMILHNFSVTQHNS